MNRLMSQLNRRRFLKLGAGAGVAATVGIACSDDTPGAPLTDSGAGFDGKQPGLDGPTTDGGGDGATADGPTPSCIETADNPLGPYYRADAPVRDDLNVLGQKGELLHVSGVVYGLGCKVSLAKAVVEVWQADPLGVYDNESPDFQLRATVPAGENGDYAYHTLLPGWYELSPGSGIFRPRHIHLRVTAPGYQELVTQLYFEGDPYNKDDGSWLPALTIALDDAKKGLTGVFDIVLEPA
jgi:catechol 1,2-dioxygenase